MKNKSLLFLLFPLACSLGGCNKNNSVDYAKKENWVVCNSTGTKSVDTFFIYPTCIMDVDGETTIEQNRKAVEADNIADNQAGVFVESTNLYMPLYRQFSFKVIEKRHFTNEGFRDAAHESIAYQDLVGALDYYFSKYNNNKPFILAGHSQGSALLYSVLTDYMQKHSDYLTRMVACYSIGFGYNKEAIGQYSNLKFATGETDTGCIISYNTYRNDHSGESVLYPKNPFVINPINWKTDETYAAINENKGSYLGGNHISGQSDAKVDLTRGILISSADQKYLLTDVDNLFGTKSYHIYDYAFFFENLKENVAKRCAAFVK